MCMCSAKPNAILELNVGNTPSKPDRQLYPFSKFAEKYYSTLPYLHTVLVCPYSLHYRLCYHAVPLTAPPERNCLKCIYNETMPGLEMWLVHMVMMDLENGICVCLMEGVWDSSVYAVS